MAQRIGIIGSTTSVNAPTWRDDELQAWERDFLTSGVIQGIGTNLAVTQRGAGANMSVDVAAGRSLYAITNTNLTPSKTYKVYHDSDAVVNVPISTADPTNPRIDIIVMKCDVSQNPDSAAGNIPSIVVVTGTPGGSPAAPATPANSLLLYRVAVAAGATSIVNGNLTDMRAYVQLNSSVLADIARAIDVIRHDLLKLTDWSVKTLASDTITVTGPLHTVETEGGAASDNLSTINAQSGSGEIIILKCENAAHVVTVKHNVGNIMLTDSTDLVLDDLKKTVGLIRKGSTWYELFRAAGSSSKLIPLAVRTADSSAAGTSSTAENDLDNKYSMGTGLWAVGRVFVWSGTGSSAFTSGNVNNRLRIGTVLVDSFTAIAATPTKFIWDLTLTVRSVSAAGQVAVKGYLYATNGAIIYEIDTVITIDMTAAQDWKVTTQFSVSGGGMSTVGKDFQLGYFAV